MSKKLEPGMSYGTLKKIEEASDSEVLDHNSFDEGHDDYRGHGIQTMTNGKTYIAEVHDLRHPEADMGSGHIHSTKPHESAHEAVGAAKAFIDHHLKSAFKKK